jgi:hypothetical protein
MEGEEILARLIAQRQPVILLTPTSSAWIWAAPGWPPASTA